MKVNSKTIYLIAMFMVVSVLIGIFIGRLTFHDSEDISDLTENTSTIPEPTKPEPLCLDLNKSTIQELSQIPGLSHQLAAEIVAYRDEYGDYVDVDELLEVDGMTKTIYNEIVDHVKVED
jgi:competence ComEA-like helix-hairpin-helix protein